MLELTGSVCNPRRFGGNLTLSVVVTIATLLQSELSFPSSTCGGKVPRQRSPPSWNLHCNARAMQMSIGEALQRHASHFFCSNCEPRVFAAAESTCTSYVREIWL